MDTNARSLVSEGSDCPDCTQWTRAEVCVESEPQALPSTSTKGLGLLLILGNFSQLEVLMCQGMEKKGKEKLRFWQLKETCPLLSAPTKKL